jgi:hypothetical protein
VRVARVKAKGYAPAGLLEHDVLGPDRPLAGERPVVQAQMLGELVGTTLIGPRAFRGREVLAAPVAEVGLGGAEVVPVGRRLDADPLDWSRLALDAEQPLDEALGLLVPNAVSIASRCGAGSLASWSSSGAQT